MRISRLGIYFTLVMGLTSMSVVLAVVLLNVHLYGSALRPVPHRLRRILFYHVARFLHVKLHRARVINDRRGERRPSTLSNNRPTTTCNTVVLNENELNNSTVPIENNSSTAPRQSIQEYKRLLIELQRSMFDSTSTSEEEKIIRDWHNVALVMDRFLFYTYLISTTVLTAVTLLVAPLFKTVPSPPNYFRLNITRD